MYCGMNLCGGSWVVGSMLQLHVLWMMYGIAMMCLRVILVTAGGSTDMPVSTFVSIGTEIPLE